MSYSVQRKKNLATMLKTNVTFAGIDNTKLRYQKAKQS